MPRISKKRLDENTTRSHATVRATNMKHTNYSNRGKKFKSVFKRLDSMDSAQITCNTINQKSLTTSTSSDSVIYVGSYTLNEKYSMIDLTKSTTSMRSEESFPISKYAHFQNCHTFYTNLVKNCNLASTASTSRLLDSIDAPKLSLKKNVKSASCLILVNDKKSNVFRNTNITREMHALNKKEQFYINQMTKLGEEDQHIIQHSLEIEDDINILDHCPAHALMNIDVPIENLMKTYHVAGTDGFL